MTDRNGVNGGSNPLRPPLSPGAAAVGAALAVVDRVSADPWAAVR